MSYALPVATPRQTWAWLCRQLRAHRIEVAVTVAAGLGAAGASVVPVTALGRLIDLVRNGAASATLVPIGVLVLVIALLGGVAAGATTTLASRLGERILAGLREQTVGVALRLPVHTLDRAGRGDLLARVGADVAAVGTAVAEVMPTVISALFLALLSVTAMFGLDWRLGLAGLAAMPTYLLALRWYLPRSAPIYAAERAAVGARSQLLMESLQGVRTVHAYRLESRHLDAINDASARARDLSVGVFALFTRFVGRISRAELLGLATILVAGFCYVRAGWGVTVGETAAAAVLFHRLYNPVSMILFTFDEIQAAGAGLARLVGVGTLAVAPAGTRTPADTDLTLRDVTFGYDERALVLRGISLRVAPGERVALVGSTGAGKTTVASIAAGLLRPGSGTATVGGVPVDQLVPGIVAIISQEAHVFAGPLIEDLRLADPDATIEAAEAALERVGALDWARGLPAGLATVVGEGGHPLTAAQAQQLALARLVLLDPAVAVLDEATAEAGSAGARELEESALAATKGRTTLLVAHRLTQAAGADRIVVLEHGEVVEEGTHDGLVAAGGRYAMLWSAWQSRS
ncbi:ABC transporter ATP-binding protein [Paractinoplanes brasiliensis]|uniref:ATP-binding cassette subfamily C protein n=1 Tax=Paractinoplanes brasiliensis TaxID=52695 RepID=A0A4R6JQ50_9ACTN|nr:ABC transporter ATP-binding protein [Actinoplanes brasiliensis]TDO38097.1 ATP-binding cassette subfamily C protein [Actinoplanes brasiliensis]GID31189.1 ABC transporter permease [Actinoplanes brasiliensis]